MTHTLVRTPPDLSSAVEASVHAQHLTPDPEIRGRLPLRQLGVVVVISALVGAGTGLAVARASGWGAHTTVQVSALDNSRAITERPADIQSILRKVLPAVVSIDATSTQTNPFFLGGGSSQVTAEGTGVIVGADGEIVTNDHVVDGASSITVTLNESTKPLKAKLVSADPAKDLALLKVNGANLPTVVWGNSTKVAVGDSVLAIGYSLGLHGGPSVTDGIISATGREVSTQTATGTSETLSDMLQTDAAISSGNSGGPLVNGATEVVGINTMVAASTRESTAENIGFAIPARSVQSLLPKLRESASK